MSQLAYTQDPAVALPGMLAGPFEDNDVRTAIASVLIQYGLGVAYTASGAANENPPGAKIPTVGATEVTDTLFLGISVRDPSRDRLTVGALISTGYAIDEPFPYLRKGRIWVLAEKAVAFGDPVFCRVTAGGAEVAGAFRDDADTADAFEIPGAQWFTPTTGAGLAIIELKPTQWAADS
jgi:hypothetical protein